MRVLKTRKTDASFELNLAPFLDIIMSIIPMLLLSVVFVQIKMIETNIPQVVAKNIEQNKKKKNPPVSVELRVSQKAGYKLYINERGKKRRVNVARKDGKLDLEGIQRSLASVKRKYTNVFSLDLAPDKNVPYDDIVLTMDAVRKLPNKEKVAFKDKESGEQVETDLMFPDVTFSNVLGN